MTFSKPVHFVLLAVAAAFAYACGVEHVRPIIAYPAAGLAIGLAGTFVVRLFVG